MSAKRYHVIICDGCQTPFKTTKGIISFSVIESFGAIDVRDLAHKEGWRFHSGHDHCPECRNAVKQ